MAHERPAAMTDPRFDRRTSQISGKVTLLALVSVAHALRCRLRPRWAHLGAVNRVRSNEHRHNDEKQPRCGPCGWPKSRPLERPRTGTLDGLGAMSGPQQSQPRSQIWKGLRTWAKIPTNPATNNLGASAFLEDRNRCGDEHDCYYQGSNCCRRCAHLRRRYSLSCCCVQ
jgi:hypothetical protein